MLLIDADTLVYRVGFATEGEPVSSAIKMTGDKLQEIFTKSGKGGGAVFIKGEGNFRYDIDPEYKAGRSSKKPVHYDAIRDSLVLEWSAKPVMGEEVDDRVSSLLWEDFKSGREEHILYSPDKDLKNTPGWHLDDKHDEPYYINEMQANRHFIYQLLAGDRVDNIKGLPEVPDEIKKRYGLRSNKVGDRTAKKLMSETSDDTDALALTAFLYGVYCEDFWKGERLMDKNARLLWMTRDYEEQPYPRDWHKYFDDNLVFEKALLWFNKWQDERRGT